MDIRQLRYFLAIAKEGQITRAAKALNMEQPPLSRQLKLMEEELGVALFERNGKQMRLTEAGTILQQKAQSILHQLDETMTEIREVDQGVRGALAIGSVFSCVSLLPDKIKAFRERFPDVTFKILEGDHFTLGEYLQTRNIELVITRLPFESAYPLEQYELIHLPSDPFVVVLPCEWELGGKQNAISMRQIKDVPLMALKSDRTVGLNEKVVNECRQFGFEPTIICECSSVAIILALVVAGIGATIMPKSVMDSFPLAQIKLLEITDTSFQSEVGIAWLRNRHLSKSARAFIETFSADR
ncbi:LysR family transcriptional regulator [Brevibacillus fluminis]|uniref:LysR family transcriptional regulator n=1 Tax=Brevibacillus fluminis TaxID=511487 RepID=A0A3M8DIX4_9BACL|nr:LysR family transcriptional regulator [Brevibacillus fluminis]RNB87077.1 LysR family transcriptional regulator [Brevibacillus fluminis]